MQTKELTRGNVPGGAFGLAASNAIFNNVLGSRLPSSLSPELRATIMRASLATTSNLPEELRITIIDCYAASIRTCFVAFTAIAGCCFALSFGIKVSRGVCATECCDPVLIGLGTTGGHVS
jgi:hypothetical protein